MQGATVAIPDIPPNVINLLISLATLALRGNAPTVARLHTIPAPGVPLVSTISPPVPPAERSSCHLPATDVAPVIIVLLNINFANFPFAVMSAIKASALVHPMIKPPVMLMWKLQTVAGY